MTYFQKNNSISRRAAIASLVIGFLFLSITIIRAAWNEPAPGCNPPDCNTAGPIWSVAPSQTLNGSLSVGTPGIYATGLSGTGTTAGVKGISSAGNAVYGELGIDGGSGEKAVYGLASDPGDYAFYSSGGKGIGLASGDIWFEQRNAGIGFPHTNVAYGDVGSLKVVASGETQIRSLGGGINFMKVAGASPGTLTSLMTISEAGIVNIVGANSLTVNNKTVCLSDGTNCTTQSTPDLQSVTDQGNVTTNGLDLKGAIANSAADLLINDWVDVQWGLLNSSANNSGNLYINDNFKANGTGEFTGNLKVGDSGAYGGYAIDATHKLTTPSFYSLSADIGGLKVTGGGGFGGYDPSATFKVTTPSFYSLTSEVGDIKINKLNSAYGTDGIQNAPTVERVYKTIPVINSNDYFCDVGFVMIGIQNSNPAKLICGKLW